MNKQDGNSNLKLKTSIFVISPLQRPKETYYNKIKNAR